MFTAEIKTVPHERQRYETVGDYWTSANGRIHVRISDMENWRYEALVAIHELVEKVITNHQGIKEADIDAFDKMFEASREPGNFNEPGNDPRAPYQRAHIVATLVEQLLAPEIGVNWDEYNTRVETL
jgi:hypothetical protein